MVYYHYIQFRNSVTVAYEDDKLQDGMAIIKDYHKSPMIFPSHTREIGEDYSCSSRRLIYDDSANHDILNPPTKATTELINQVRTLRDTCIYILYDSTRDNSEI